MRELLEPPAALVTDGQVRHGTFRGPIPRVNLIDAQPFALPLPRWLRSLRLKEWQAIQFGNARWFGVIALFDAKVLALAQVKIYDRERRRKYVFERKLPSWAMRAPTNLLESQMRYEARGVRMAFVNRLSARRLSVELELPESPHMPALRGSLIGIADDWQPQVVSIPFAETSERSAKGMVSHKGCLALEGELALGDETLHFGGPESFMLIDDHKGYYPHVMRWDWLTGGGVDARGRQIAFNLTRNDSIDPERYNENCVWIDRRLHLLPPVVFRRRPELEPERWELRDAGGAVAVDFDIELDGYVRVNALVMESRYRGPFGRVSGRVDLPGERVELDGLFGMAEDFYLRC